VYFVSFVVIDLFAVDSFNISPYAKRPEGSRNSTLFFLQTFGTARNMS
jgi:hypothetical protein